MKIIVIGAGAWGTAIALAALKKQHRVQLWVRDATQAAAMHQQRINSRYLSAVALPESLEICAGDAALAADAAQNDVDLAIIATPVAGLRNSLSICLNQELPTLWLSKGFDENGLLGHELRAQIAPKNRANFHSWGVLSGPSFALEVAKEQPTALVCATADLSLAEKAVEAFHSESLRIYTSSDVVGVEVGGAVKNVLAIAAGLCDGLELGLNARAALLTRGLAEMTRLAVALGGQAQTLMGLSGLGDLLLTATGNLSRNRQVGLMLAQGLTADEATNKLGHVAEGVRCAAAVLQRAQSLNVQMPITQCVVALLGGQINAEQAVQALMGREPTTERNATLT